MKHVTLLGDSIRLGYAPVVQRELAGVADVWSPKENGGHTVNMLTNLHVWALNRQPAPDLVHLNCGLHDLKTIYYGGRENVVPLEHYRHNVALILRTLQQRTRARLVWATTTPVNEHKAHTTHAAYRDFDRYEADVLAYNAAARDVCRELSVPVNDLHAVVSGAGADQLLTDDGVHFTPAGYELLGLHVAQFVREQWKSVAVIH